MNQDQSGQANSNQIYKTIKNNQASRKLKSVLSFLLFVAGVFLAAFLINQFIFQSYFVDGSSMTPTLQNNDRLIIEKIGRSFSMIRGQGYIPSRGQIVVLDSALVDSGGHEEQLIKRVIGLPGETVIIENGKVIIKSNDAPQGFDPDKVLGLSVGKTYSEGRIETQVGQDEIFVLGDNRGQNGSYDSRAFGSVKASKLEGRLWVRILPIDEAQIF